VPLPANGLTIWPPENLAAPYESFQLFDAWYTSDTDTLSRLYSDTSPQNVTTSIWGQLKRRFWGTPTPGLTSQRPVKMHVPVAAEVSRMSSQILFGQMPDVSFEEPDAEATDDEIPVEGDKPKPPTPTQISTERLSDILDDSAHAALLAGAEYASAHGGSYLRVIWNADVVPDKPLLDVVAADCAVPQFWMNRLQSVIFWRELAPKAGSKSTWRLLECHSRGRIEYGLYEAPDSKGLGFVQPLADHPDTEYLADVVDSDAGVDTGSDLLTAVYIPNIAPNGAWRKLPGASALGRSDYLGVEDLMDQLDEVYTAWMRDIRLGKARMIVPKGFLQVGTTGSGSTFNADQEVFVEPATTAPSSVKDNESSFEYFQPSIRTQDHMDAVVHLLARIYAACGFSPQSFGDAGGDSSQITATEVTAREKLTILTRQAKILYWRPQLSTILAALMDVDEFVFSGPGRGDAMPQIEFADAAAQDPKILADTLQALNLSESASIETRVQMLHEDWTEVQIKAEVAQIREDYSMLPDPSEKNLWAAVAGNGSNTGGVNVKAIQGVEDTGTPEDDDAAGADA